MIRTRKNKIKPEQISEYVNPQQLFNSIENNLKNELDKRIVQLEEHYKKYEKEMDTIQEKNKLIYDDLYGFNTKVEHSSLRKMNNHCGAHQDRILDLYKNSSPENMNYLIKELENYKDCLKKIEITP